MIMLLLLVHFAIFRASGAVLRLLEDQLRSLVLHYVIPVADRHGGRMGEKEKCRH